jgi:hypothetical protein
MKKLFLVALLSLTQVLIFTGDALLAQTSQLPIQFKLSDINSTKNGQAFFQYGNPKSEYLEPDAGYLFCLFKVETINPNNIDIDFTGSKLKIEGPEGEIKCYTLFSMKGYNDSYVPCSAVTKSIKHKKNGKDSYLIIIKEDVQSFDFMYENSDTLKIFVPNH